MTSLASPSLDSTSPATRLRLVPRAKQARDRTTEDARPSASSARAEAPVLVAGGDADRRAAVIDELAAKLPDGTSFQQAAALWELMAQAPGSRLVVLSGDLEELAPESLLHALAKRHPGLPVVSLEPATLVTA
jgi:hypothetical protein